jgi:topoisomerase-4 subunit B
MTGPAGWDTPLVSESQPAGRTATTHDWSNQVDAGHLEHIRQDAATFAPGGIQHLVLEVIAYAADEAEYAAGGGRCTVTRHPDGSVSVQDDGRGTDTRLDGNGQPVKKPVMTSKDLRFFDFPEAQLLPDGHPRRGISVVGALSEWLVHTNRRADGAWTQRYEHGTPVTGLVPVPADGTTGTTVHFLADQALRTTAILTVSELTSLAASWPHLTITLRGDA